MQLDSGKPPAQTIKQRGFTLVELLIVIVVIAILAAITIIAYNGVTQKAHAVALQSDLSNGGTALRMYQGVNGVYPSTIDAVNDGQGMKASSGDTFSYYKVSSDGSAYCLQADGFGMTYAMDGDNAAASGHCAGTVAVSGTAPIISTFAGNGTAGYVNGAATSALFNGPTGLAIDTAGNLYVVDKGNNVIRKITPAGVVSTFAGNGTAGYIDGSATSAEFNQPSGLAIDSAGNLYVVDANNHVVRKITPSGTVSTFAGNGAAGYVDGAAASAEFNLFSGAGGMAIDTSNNVYVADAHVSGGSMSTRKITPSGMVSTVMSKGGYGLALDASGNIYFVDQSSHIYKATSAGVVSTVAGYGVSGWRDGPAMDAKFSSPTSLAIDASGDHYIGDGTDVRKLTPSGIESTVAASSNFGYIVGLAVDSSGNVYASANGNTNRIYKISQ